MEIQMDTREKILFFLKDSSVLELARIINTSTRNIIDVRDGISFELPKTVTKNLDKCYENRVHLRAKKQMIEEKFNKLPLGMRGK